MNEPYLRQTGDGIVIRVRVQPNAKRTGLAGVHGDELKVRIHAPPVDGKANAALLEFLRDRLGIPKAALELTSGETSRSKHVLVRGVSAEQVVARLSPEIG